MMYKGFKIHELEGVECKIFQFCSLVISLIFAWDEYFSTLHYNFVWHVSFSDRLNFWDFGGDPDYELIRTELYKDTQVSSLVGYVTSV